MKNLKDEFVMVPLKKTIADAILNIADKIDVGPVEVLNYAVDRMVGIAHQNFPFLNNEEVENLPERVEVAEQVSDEEAKELLLESLKEVIKTAHSVEINIIVDK